MKILMIWPWVLVLEVWVGGKNTRELNELKQPQNARTVS